MATVNFSVPEKVKAAFNKAFAGENKSAVIARLMRQAVEERRRERRRRRAIDGLLALRHNAKAATNVAVRAARARGRA